MKLTLTQKSPASRSFLATVLLPTPPGPDKTPRPDRLAGAGLIGVGIFVALAATGNLLAVSRAMGHASPATTAIYAATSDSDLDVIADAVTR